MKTHDALAALARFHLHVGARLALRAAAPLAGLPFFVVLLQQDPGAAVRAAATGLLGPRAGPGAGLLVALLALALASWAAPRVTAGLRGWPRHLPASQVTHRRAALLALVTVQAPLVLGLLLLAPAAAFQPAGLAPLRLVALPLVLVAAAVAVWPGERPARCRPLALLALVVLAAPTLSAILAALLLTVLGEHLSGPLAADTIPERKSPWSLPTPALIAGRALGVPAIGTALLALLPLGAMTLFRVNNDLGPGAAAGAARLGGGLAVVLLLAGLAERLAQRRPAWPWARSLPVSSSRRTADDAALLAFAALLPLVATAALDPVSALTVAAGLPYLAFRAAGALHAGTRPRAGVATPFLGEGVFLAGVVALLPWLALVALAAAPLAWRTAADRDRRRKVSRWDALHHRAVGDPVAWSAR